MDRDDMVDTGATVATAAGIRQARRKVYRKIYRTLYAGVPKRVGPIVALGSILSRFTKTAAPYDYTQIDYEGVIPSMISKEYYEKTASPLYAFKAALERNKTAGILDSLSKAKYRYNTASTSKATAIKNYHENLFNEDMLKDMIRQYRQRHSTIYNPNTRYGQRAKLYGEIISADEGPKLRKQVNRLATELRFTRGQQPQLKELAEKVDSPLYVAKKTLNI